MNASGIGLLKGKKENRTIYIVLLSFLYIYRSVFYFIYIYRSVFFKIYIYEFLKKGTDFYYTNVIFSGRFVYLVNNIFIYLRLPA